MPNYKIKENSLQHRFQTSRLPIQAFTGAYANGKTTGAAIKALNLAIDYPGSTGLLARATYPKLNDTLRKVWLEWCPNKWIKKRPTQDDNSAYLQNGSIINFRYISQRGRNTADGSTTSNLLSATYDYIVVDQIEDPEITHKDFIDLIGRLRGQTAYRPQGDPDPTMPSTGPRWFIVTANPSRNWFFREVVQPFQLWKDKGIFHEKLLVDSVSKLPIMDLFNGDIYSNADNLPADYIRNQEATLKGQSRDRFLLGKWAAYEGLVFQDYDQTVHGLSRDDMLDYLSECHDKHVSLQPVEGYDFGLVSPSCYLFGLVDDHGRVFILDGFYQTGFDYRLQPDAIRAIRMKYANMFGLKFSDQTAIWADPSIFRKSVVAGNSDTGDTVAKLLSGLGLRLRPAMNDKLPGLTKVASYFNGLFQTPHIMTGQTPGPLLYICDELQFFNDEATAYYWKKDTFNNPIDEPQDHDDHAMDTVRYLLSKLPEPSKIVIPSERLPPKWKFWHEVDEDQERFERNFV